MKKVLLIVLCIAAICFVSCAKEEAKEYQPETLAAKYFYCYGNYLAKNYATVFPDMDFEAMAEGFKSAANDSFLFTDEEFQQIISEYENQLQSQVALDNLAKAEAFLNENAKKSSVVTTASGLQYEVVKKGNGKAPSETSTVTVDYELFDIDGNLIQSTIQGGSPASFGLNNVIQGFREGLLLMNEGSEYRLYIHPSMGYGEYGSGNIQPNQALVFDVTLYTVQ